jgi:chromosomal replication initiation ATPase DnaA
VNGTGFQLVLPFVRQPAFDEADFLRAPSNDAAWSWVEREDWPDRRLALWGDAGCGKTHLLHIWARWRGARLLNGPELRSLDQLPWVGGLALDDADRISDERLLLHLLNTVRDRSFPILLVGREPPSRWPVRLPDLSSRLRAISAVEILPPEDALRRDLLMRLLAERQLDVSPSVQEWLLLHLTRSAAALADAVARLDQASLSLGKAITRAMAARILLNEPDTQDAARES